MPYIVKIVKKLSPKEAISANAEIGLRTIFATTYRKGVQSPAIPVRPWTELPDPEIPIPAIL
jgi:hypothetical protein